MKRGEQNETFLQWAEEHQAILWKVTRAFAAPALWAELHQDLLVALWESIPAFRGTSKVSTYVYRVAFNRAMNWKRDSLHTKRQVYEPLENLPSPSPGGDEELVARLYQAIAALPEFDRTLALLFLDDLSYREMAEVVGISESSVGVRLHRIRKRLARELNQEASQ